MTSMMLTELNEFNMLIISFLLTLIVTLLLLFHLKKMPIHEPKIWFFGMLGLILLIALQVGKRYPATAMIILEYHTLRFMVETFLFIFIHSCFMLIFTLPSFSVTRKKMNQLGVYQLIITASAFSFMLLPPTHPLRLPFLFLPLLLLEYLVLRRILEIKTIALKSDHSFPKSSIYLVVILVLFISSTSMGAFVFIQHDAPEIIELTLLTLFILVLTMLFFRTPEAFFMVDGAIKGFIIIENSSGTLIHSFSEAISSKDHEEGSKNIEEILLTVLNTLEMSMKELIHPETTLKTLTLGTTYMFVSRGHDLTTILITTKNNGIVRALSRYLHRQFKEHHESRIQELIPRDDLKNISISPDLRNKLATFLVPFSHDLQRARKYLPHSR